MITTAKGGRTRRRAHFVLAVLAFSATLACAAASGGLRGTGGKRATSSTLDLAPLPEEAATAYQEGLVAAAGGDWERAARAFSDAAAQEKTPPWLWYDLGVAWDRTGDTEEAERAYREALSREPRLGPAIVNLARLAYRTEGAGAAEDVLRHHMEQAPDLMALQVELARLWVAEDDEESLWRARQLVRQLLYEEPLQPDARRLDGMVALREGDAQEAMRRLETAWLLEPGDAVLAYALGSALLHLAESRQPFGEALRVEATAAFVEAAEAARLPLAPWRCRPSAEALAAFDAAEAAFEAFRAMNVESEGRTLQERAQRLETSLRAKTEKAEAVLTLYEALLSEGVDSELMLAALARGAQVYEELMRAVDSVPLPPTSTIFGEAHPLEPIVDAFADVFFEAFLEALVTAENFASGRRLPDELLASPPSVWIHSTLDAYDLRAHPTPISALDRVVGVFPEPRPLMGTSTVQPPPRRGQCTKT